MTKKQAKLWDDVITRAEERGEFYIRDQNAAASWMTCAVGEFKGRYQQTYKDPTVEPSPKSKRLDKLGMDFYYAVKYDNVGEARKVWAKIQKYFENKKPLTKAA